MGSFDSSDRTGGQISTVHDGSIQLNLSNDVRDTSGTDAPIVEIVFDELYGFDGGVQRAATGVCLRVDPRLQSDARVRAADDNPDSVR
ncbi:MAG: hypothetical protein R2849_03460 [Thermomicrobiales bacterium]